MSPTEMDIIVEHATHRKIEQYEMQRLGWYFSVLPYARKNISPLQLYKFGWDKTRKPGNQLTQAQVRSRSEKLLSKI